MSFTVPRAPGTEVVNLAVANEALELVWGNSPPTKITFEFETNAGGYAFVGTEGSALSVTYKVDVAADNPYVLELRNGRARNLSITSLFIEADTNDTNVAITTEGP